MLPVSGLCQAAGRRPFMPLHKALRAALVLFAVVSTAAASPAKNACQPFDAAEVRRALRAPVGQPKGTAGAEMLSCAAQGGGLQVTLNHTLEPDPGLGSSGEFQQSVERARSAGQVTVQEFKETRCATILPSGGSKFGAFKAWCVLHSKQGRAVSLDVIAPSGKRLPSLETLRTLAEAAAARIP
jgi:hypothetical protein